MTGSGENEVTLRQFIDSVWFRGLARSCMVLCTLLVSAFIGLWAVVAGNTDRHVNALDAQVTQIVQTMTSRAQDNETFQQDTGDQLDALKSQIADVRVNIGIVRGILTELQQQKVAQTRAPAELSRP